MASAQQTLALPRVSKLAGWLMWFVIRFYISAAFWLAGAAENHSKFYIMIGVIELSLGVLLSLKNRTGLILTRVWLILESLTFVLLTLLAIMPPSDAEGAIQMFAYAVGSTIITV
jgi:hypothetical protein